MNSKFLYYYFKLFEFVAKNRNEKRDLPERYIHSHLVCVLATGALMWAYAVLAFFTIANPVAWIVGVICSVVHLMSPLLFRINNNRFLNTNVFLLAGITHQATFGFYSGGFLSNIIIWFGILPLLAGITCGRKGVVTWVGVCSLVTFFFLYLEYINYPFPNLITPFGLLLAQSLITFGWIYASAVVIFVFLILVEQHQDELEKKKEGIQNLICVITHDISNPLSVVIGRTNFLKKSDLPINLQSSVGKISSATSNITEIVNNVRNLYATELGKSSIELLDTDLVIVLNNLKENFSERLEAKKITLTLNISDESVIIKTNGDILLHQILGNILSNAIKFSNNNDEITISLNKSKDKVNLKITDKGIGIPKDLIDKLFDLASKTNRTGTSGEAGTGFGLPIVKTYVEKLDGKLIVESVTKEEGEHHGTTFIISFPT